MMTTTSVFLFGLICVLTIHDAESAALVCPQKITATTNGSATVKCYYSLTPTANKYDRKYLCRLDGWSGRCKAVIMSTTGYVHEKFLGRATIEENRNEGRITMTLSNLQKSDEGIYICGTRTYESGLKAEIHLAVTEAQDIPIEAKLIYGQIKGVVTFQCEFDVKYTSERKYLCKHDKSGCKPIIDSVGTISKDYSGRVLVEENNPRKFFIKLAPLQSEDNGLYSCGFGHYVENGDSIQYDLRINEATDIPQGPRSLSTRLGGSVSVQCNYNPKKNYTHKFFCKWNNAMCKPVINTDGYIQDILEGKALMYDDPANGLMQVLLNDMSKEDEGVYWCVLTGGKYDQISAIHVKISEGTLKGLVGDKSIHVTAGKQARLPCSYPCRYNSNEKYWCKWTNTGCMQLTSQEDDQNSLSLTCENQELVLNIDSVSQKDNGWYWCMVKNGPRILNTMAVQMIVEEPSIDSPSGGINSRSGNAKSNNEIDSSSSYNSNKNSTITAAVVSVCFAILAVSAVFLYFRLRRKNSDLVSIGSYRTNISMTDLDNSFGKDNPTVIDSQETDISHSKDDPKITKRRSQEELDYSSFLIHNMGSPNEDVTL